MQQFVDPVIYHVKEFKRRLNLQTVPTFLFGYSLGGLIEFHALLNEQALFAGAIFCNPLIRYTKENALFKLLAQYCCSACYCCCTSTRLADVLIQGCKEARKNFQAISLPLLVFQGMKDNVVDKTFPKLFVDECSSEDKTYIKSPKSCHGLTCLLKEDNFYTILLWIHAHTLRTRVVNVSSVNINAGMPF